MPEITLLAPDISCEHCKRTIETEMGTLAGVAAVDVDPPGRTVRVTYDEARVTESAIRARLDQIGYPAAR
ncbi:MAG TPA: heavy-metal-associated domain-containing protein [Candidatus Binatia bacterium]|nr:heavy-metal-associated domain-containing protein [Candidatus Binatia bacterium]